MELDLLQIFGGFAIGLIVGVVAMLVVNKIKSGSASPAGVKQEFEEYKNEVEAHFEATSKKFQNMTEQYQDLYQHLSVGATSLCRPDSVAAALVDGSDPSSKPAQIEASVTSESDDTAPESVESNDHSDTSTPDKPQPDAGSDSDSDLESAAQETLESTENAAGDQSKPESNEDLKTAAKV